MEEGVGEREEMEEKTAKEGRGVDVSQTHIFQVVHVPCIAYM